MYSPADAPGIMITPGYVGEPRCVDVGRDATSSSESSSEPPPCFEASKQPMGRYITADGGVTWSQFSSQHGFYAIDDHGAFIVLVPYASSTFDTLRYTWDGGQTVQSYEIIDRLHCLYYLLTLSTVAA